MQVIRYQQNGKYLILNPSSCCGLSIEEIAAKDVPIGCEWVIIDADDAPPLELTPEELRAAMPCKSMVEFRSALRKVRTLAFPEGIYAVNINVLIDQIAYLDLQEEARDYFNLGQYAERTNSWVDIFGIMVGLHPNDIDALWK